MNDETSLGILDLLGSGAGFIRRRESNYQPGDHDIYVHQRLIRQYGLREGDAIAGEVGEPPDPGKSPPLSSVHAVNGEPPERASRRPRFRQLRAVHPDERLVLECGLERRGGPDYTNRIIDLFCPIGKGQRATVVAPSKAGKTMVLQAVAEGIVTNDPDCTLFILLIDERPEEVTEMEAIGYGEVVASSFDYPPKQHLRAAEVTLERARRQVETGKDVVVILDSITRLARAHNTVKESSGRTLSGGLDATALKQPKRFLGSARKVDPNAGEGSLTIIATALVDTGSRMDQVIFEEFKGTGNSELVLSRELSDRRIFPAIDLTASRTRRDELLLSDEEMRAMRVIRRRVGDRPPPEAMTDVLAMMKRTKTNADLVDEVTASRSR